MSEVLPELTEEQKEYMTVEGIAKYEAIREKQITELK